MSKTLKTLNRIVSGLLVAVFLISAFMTGRCALGWYYARDHKTNEAFGWPIYVAVTLEKIEKDGDGEITTRVIQGAEFYLFKVEEDGDVQIGERTVTDKNGQIQVDGLYPGAYYFEETRPGYAYVYDRDESDAAVTRYEFTLTGAEPINQRVKITAYNRRVTGPLVIGKVVQNEDGSPLTPEQKEIEFLFTITFSDGGEYAYRIDGEGEELSVADDGVITLKHGQTAVFVEIPLGVLYTVIESPVADYITQSDNHQGHITGDDAIAMFTNTFVSEPPDGQGSLTIVKAVEGERSYNEADREFHFILEVDGREPEEFILKDGESKRFDNLPVGAAYVVRETDARPDGYALTGVTNGAGTLTAADISSVFTNTFVDRVMVLVEGEKTWDLGDYHPALPELITVNLKDGGLIVDTATVAPDEDGKWTYVFEAPKYNGEGEEIQYTAEEAAIDQWEARVSGVNIENVYIPPVITTQPPSVSPPREQETQPPSSPPGVEPPESTPPSVQPPAGEGDEETPSPRPTPLAPPRPDDQGYIAPPPGQTPRTGDASDLMFWFVLMILSLFGLIATRLWRKRNEIGKLVDKR